jgi:tetratricopeptide (TPR) repeat protein
MGRLGAVEIPLAPLDRQGTAALAARHSPQLSRDAVDQVWEVSGGLPFGVVELARSMQRGSAQLRRPGAAPLGTLAPTIRTVLERVAVTGTTFDTDEFLALSGLPEDKAFDCLDAALAAMVIDRTLAGYQFRHPLIREALLDDVPPHRQRLLHRACAERLIALGASPARIGHHLLMAGATAAAAPYVLRAAETEAAIGAYRDALALVDSVLPHATGPERARLYALRADLLAATAHPAAVQAYREAIGFADEAGRRILLARMARMAAYSGDLPTAEAALDGLEPDGGPADATILLVRGNLAYIRGDLDTAWQATANARRIVVGSKDDWQALDLLTLQGLIAHHRGDYLQQIRQDLQRTRNDPRMATAVFDSQLCVAEYLLYGTTPYAEVISFAKELRVTAQRAGALRAVAFATALVGEAALLAGDLDLAERELRDAVDLHREIAAPAGEAHSLQRLAETHLALGDRPAAKRLLQRALPLARWSAIAPHLLQRVYGTMIMAAADPVEARAVVDRTQALWGHTDRCTFCDVMFAVPAAIACADAGDVDDAIRYLAEAQKSAARWEYTAWQAAILEARAHLARAQGDVGAWAPLTAEAAGIFEEAGQPLDAARCRAMAAVNRRGRGP